MKRLVWSIATVVILLWSLLSAGVYALLSVFGDALIRSSDWVSAHPEVSRWLAWGLDFAQDFGLVLVAVVWAMVTLGIVAAAWLMGRGGAIAGQIAQSRGDKARTLKHDASALSAGPPPPT